MTLLNEDGSLMSKENYKYEFDFAGNWNKMTTSVAVIDSGKLSFEPTEITYRSIMYYLDENMVRMSQPAVAPAQPNTAAPAPTNAAANSAKPNVEPKSQPPVEFASKNQPAANNKVLGGPPAPSKKELSGSSSAEVKSVASNPSNSRVQMDSEPPPSATPKPILRPISGGILNGAAVNLPPPMYPDTAKRMRTSGVVIVEVVIDESGKVISATAGCGPATLREAARQAAMRARFSPTKLSGQPVKVFGTIS